MRVLLIEDDAALARAVSQSLQRASYKVDIADNGEDAEFMGESGEYDAIILDLGLPQKDGLTILGEWRERKVSTPVLILTARNSWRDKVQGLRRGADDYLAKPFQPEELEARLEALIRRSYGSASSILSVDAFEIDLSLRSVTRDGAPLDLTPNEYRLLTYLALNRGRVVSKTELTEHVYDQAFNLDSNVIEATVARLRKKVGSALIKTQRGHGYVVP
ncbi:MAG: response regulator transcription factor [Pseudomonadota bacterium]